MPQAVLLLPGAVQALRAIPRGPDVAARLADTLARFHAVSTADGTRLASHCWGIAAQRLDPGRAAQLVQMLEEAEVAACAVEESELAVLPRAEICQTMAFSERGAVWGTHAALLAPAEGPSSPAPAREFRWDEVELLAGCAFREERRERQVKRDGPSAGERVARIGLMAVTGLPIGLGKTKRVDTEVLRSEMFFLLDIFLKGAPAALHVEAETFDYSCLGPQRGYAVMQNVRLLAGALAERSPGADRNHGLKILVSGAPLNAMTYRTREDYLQECRWHLTLRHRPFNP